jgi:hypothetical protein
VVDRTAEHPLHHHFDFHLLAHHPVDYIARLEVLQIEPWLDLDDVAAGGRHVEELVQVLARIDLESQGAPAAGGVFGGDGGGGGAFADAAFAGDQNQLSLPERNQRFFALHWTLSACAALRHERIVTQAPALLRPRLQDTRGE